MEENELKMQENTIKIYKNEEKEAENIEVCPICGSSSILVNGRCKTCYACGYSLCSM